MMRSEMKIRACRQDVRTKRTVMKRHGMIIMKTQFAWTTKPSVMSLLLKRKNVPETVKDTVKETGRM